MKMIQGDITATTKGITWKESWSISCPQWLTTELAGSFLLVSGTGGQRSHKFVARRDQQQQESLVAGEQDAVEDNKEQEHIS